jgi:hypothetical protein
MKKVLLSVFIALATQFAYAGDHVIVIKDGTGVNQGEYVVEIDDGGRTEVINVITGDVVKVLVKDIYGHIANSFLMTAEEDGDCPVYIPALSFGWHAEIWVNNQLVYTFYE